MKITLKLQETSEFNLLQMVDKNYLEVIKNVDNDKPYLKAYVVMQEGEMMPELVGVEQKPIRVSSEFTQQLTAKLNLGTKFYFDHYEKSPDEPRQVLGSVIGKKNKKIQGKETAAVVGYFKENYIEAVKNMEHVSLEMDIDYNDMGSYYEAKSIETINAIAILPEGIKPGVPAAKAIASIIAKNTNQEPSGDDKNMKLEELSFQDLRAELARRMTFPHQISPAKEAIGDIVFDENGNPRLTGKDIEYKEHVQAIAEKLAVKKAGDAGKELEKTQLKVKELEQKLFGYESIPKLKEAAKGSNLGEKFVEYVEKKATKKFKPDSMTIDSFIEDCKDDYSLMVGEENPTIPENQLSGEEKIEL